MPASTSRSTRPSSSSSRSRWESSRSESPGTALPSSPKRIGRSVRAQTIAPVQRFPISSIAAWKCGQTEPGVSLGDCGEPARPLDDWDAVTGSKTASLLNVSDRHRRFSPCRARWRRWPRSSPSAARTTSVGTAKPPGGPLVVAAKTVPPRGRRRRPAARRSCRCAPRRATQRSCARPAAPVGVLADRRAGFAEPGGATA